MCARPKKRSVISRRLYVDPLHPSTTVAQPDWSSLMDLLVQSWFHAGWPHPQLQTIAHPSAHPNSAFESALFKKCVCCAEYGIPPPPPRAKKPATCVNHTLLVRWSSVRGLHGNSDVTHTELAQGQLRGKIPATLLVDDCRSWLRIKELQVDDVGHSTGG